ncbi:hypothetical protein G3I76_51430 [Streptomyces sp. SID11233]|uniref:hypothetical protein n=1 Tax=Streptomyces sp. SID11385 TaxID=2706031 RepID=UPI0013C0EB51|nr:hypothetical protein [Streptomyces sp. SID11385]NEA40786.1 hypothetical protein [Streptomyces sp. SID11385]NED88476.1 hypothetical protein [Streptomyces sp. SID11233]
MAAITVLALTGFSTGRGHGSSHSRHGSGHGGGCSSSSQRQNGSSHSTSSTDDDDDDYTSGFNRGYNSGTNRRHTTAPTSTPTEDDTYANTPGSPVQATLVSCVTKARPWATVRLKNSGTRTESWSGSVTFSDVNGAFLTDGTANASGMGVRVAKGKTKTLKIKPADGREVADIRHCEVETYGE